MSILEMVQIAFIFAVVLVSVIGIIKVLKDEKNK